MAHHSQGAQSSEGLAVILGCRANLQGSARRPSVLGGDAIPEPLAPIRLPLSLAPPALTRQQSPFQILRRYMFHKTLNVRSVVNTVMNFWVS